MFVVTQLNRTTGVKSLAIIESNNYTIIAFDPDVHDPVYDRNETFEVRDDGHFPPPYHYRRAGGQHTNSSGQRSRREEKNLVKSVIQLLDREDLFIYITETVQEILASMGKPQSIPKDKCIIDLTEE